MYPTTLHLPVELLLESPGLGHVCVHSSSDTAMLPRKCRQSTGPAANTGFWKSYPIKLIRILAAVAATTLTAHIALSPHQSLTRQARLYPVSQRKKRWFREDPKLESGTAGQCRSGRGIQTLKFWVQRRLTGCGGWGCPAFTGSRSPG